MDWREFLEKRDNWDKQEKKLDRGSKINISDSIREMKDAQAKLTHRKRRRENPKTWASEEEKDAGKRKPSIFEDANPMKTPLTRVSTHTTKPVTSGGVAVDTKIGRGSGMSDHQSKTGRKEQYITPENAEKWKSWLEKEDKKKPTMFPRIRREFEDEKDEDPMVYDNKTASWESWLEKNNGIETSHKEGEKKEEWDGKFSSSTIRDDAKDEKAESEEESLEELTDGKLEEVEKLKAWEIFLDKTNNATQNFRYYKARHDKNDEKILDNDGTNYDKSPYHNQEIEASEENRNEGTGKLDQDKRNWNTTEGERGGSKKTPTGQNITHDGSEYNESTGDYSATQFGTNRILDRFKEEDRVAKLKPKKPSKPNAINPNQPYSKDDYALHDTEDVGKKITAGMQSLKSWELWLEKDALDGKQSKAGIPKASEDVMDEAQEVINRNERGKLNPMYKSWEGWLEKQQGAGDARFGNQHLTGMEQHPVADDDSIELSPETEENNEKQEKTEDKEDKDNKPYKALSQE